jgi:hypothetical protein
VFLGFRPAITASGLKGLRETLHSHRSTNGGYEKHGYSFSLSSRVKNIRRFIFQQLQRRLPRLLRLGPSCFHQRRHLGLGSRAHLPLRLVNRFPLCRHPLCHTRTNIGQSFSAQLPFGPLDRFAFLCSHPLCDPSSNICQRLSTEFPLLLWRRFRLWRCAFDLGPSRLLSCSHLGSGGCAELVFLRGFSGLGTSGNFAAQDFIQFTLQ